MIIWVASYPKSGNTWIRLFLDSLLYSEDDLDINNIKIDQFPQKNDFNGLVKDFDDLKEVSINYIVAQDRINLDNKIKFFKTHSANWKAYNTSFTNFENTLGVIHIIRDPRNVITSILNHYSKENYLEALEFMNNTTLRTCDKQKFLTIISSWSNHYNSWKKFKKNYLLIRYEDLIHKPEKTFEKVSNYVSNLLKIKITTNKIKEAIKKNSFNNLKKLEEKFGFDEATLDENSNKKKFFNLGPENDWKKLLPDEIKRKIEKKFQKEMVELGYLNH